jgi:glucose/arabinose dehydrogenase
MTQAVRACLLAALTAATLASCGGGGSSSPPVSPPASPTPSPSPTSPPSPPAGPNAPPVFSSGATVSVQENMVGVVYRPLATDPEAATVTYGAAIGGPDAARFTMNPVTREIRFAAQPNFEAPADAGANNVYDISFTASDGTNTVTQTVAVTVTNVANGFRVRRLATGLSAPIYAAALPDGSGRVVVVERAGRIRVMDSNTGAIAATDFLNITTQIDTAGEKGLLAIAFSPNFVADRTFYLHMNPLSSNITEIRQYRTLSTDLAQADTATSNTILTIDQPSAAGFTNHKGGFLAFDASGRLLIGLGDGGSGGDPLGNGQNRNTLLGKILRIDVATDSFPADPNRDYAIPPTNPFATTGGSPEIMAIGVRNPFRGSVDPITGDIFIGEVGQGAVEEVDRIPVGASGLLNYGWNRREGSQPYNGGADDPSFILPVAEYGHGSLATQGNSITGGVVYRGPIEDLQGQYLFADFVTPNLWSIPIASLNVGTVLPAASFTVRNTSFAPDAGTINSVVAFGVDNANNVYIVSINGSIFKLEPLP